MKKKFLLIMACIGFCTALNAQDGSTPTPPTPGTRSTDYANTVTGQNAPIAPATLLLLGLGTSAAGVMIYKNQNKKEE